MTALYFSRATLKRDASIAALAPLLLGKTGRYSSSGQAGHHLVWSLFADDADRRRDFLWREIDQGTFVILSARQPKDRHALFDLAEPKRFVPALAAGDVLGFSLRANPVVRRRVSAGARSVKHDVVMDALRAHPPGSRSERRFPLLREKGLAWLMRQGRMRGFEVKPKNVRIEGYEQRRVARKSPASELSYSTVDYEGTLTVTSPDAFVSSVAVGFGSAKAYGCGLMLIRRI